MKSKNSKRMMALISAAVLTAGLMTGAVAGGDGEAVPTIARFSVESGVGEVVTFSEADFLSRVSDSADLHGIVLTALPLPAHGVLCVGDRALLVGEAVTAANLSSLRFIPAAGAGESSASFGFIPVFDTGAGTPSGVSVAAVVHENHRPAVIDAKYETIKNIQLVGEFPATDADGDELTFTIVDPPKKGTVAPDENSPRRFVYTPKENKTGADSFTFTATDPSGETSDLARVTIRIVKNAAKMTYADMEGDPAHYAALKLAADGVLIGKRMGDSYYFEPTVAMTRGEFVALAMTCLGAEVDGSVTSTGFADSDSTAAWLVPYVAAAARMGVVSGIPTDDGRRVFDPDSPITRAEAAVVLAKAVGLSVATSTGPSVIDAVDAAAVPVWAETPMSLAASGGIVGLFDDGTLRPMAAVTRADAANMLYSAKVLRSELETAGLLDRAFA